MKRHGWHGVAGRCCAAKRARSLNQRKVAGTKNCNRYQPISQIKHDLKLITVHFMEVAWRSWWQGHWLWCSKFYHCNHKSITARWPQSRNPFFLVIRYRQSLRPIVVCELPATRAASGSLGFPDVKGLEQQVSNLFEQLVFQVMPSFSIKMRKSLYALTTFGTLEGAGH